jgi:histidinol dehydrogenase
MPHLARLLPPSQWEVGVDGPFPIKSRVEMAASGGVFEVPMSASEAPIRFLDYSMLDAPARAALLKRADQDVSGILEPTRKIIEAVRVDGDAALSRFAMEFDKAHVPADAIACTAQEFDEAFNTVERPVIEAIEFAVDNIRRYHEQQKPEEAWMKEMRPGVFAGDRWHPIPSVALYVPRGKGAFPSVTMMTSVPAVVAGVSDIAILTPPTPEGKADAATLVAARISGVLTVYKAGGAQAVAAAAYGTMTIGKKAKIVGPGSPWVVAAKRLLADAIDTGLPAGPSESIVFADESADGRLAALDLLIEAEHGPDSSAYLVTTNRKVAEDAIAALPTYWGDMGSQRRSFSHTVLSGPRGGVLLMPSLEAAYDFINDYAPEHLEILSDEPFRHLGAFRNAAEVLLGSHSPFMLGNFVIGSNCVLPTGGAAKTFGPLSVTDYMKRSSFGYVTSTGYPGLAKHARVLAEYEGFEAHANAVGPRRDALLRGNAKGR